MKQIFVTLGLLIQIGLSNSAGAEPISNSQETAQEGIYYVINISTQSKYVRDQDVDVSSCKYSSGNSSYYYFEAAGKPTFVNTLVSIQKCKSGYWSDECADLNPSELTSETQKVITSEKSIIFSSTAVNGSDNCGKDIQLYILRNEYTSSQPESHSYRAPTLAEALQTLSSVPK